MMKKLLVPAIALTALLLTSGLAMAASKDKSADSGGKHGLVPHKALYDIKMTAKRTGSQLINISGQMFYEWRPECDAWTTGHQFNLTYEYPDSPPIHVTSDFSTYEAFDGESFNFNSRRKRNGKLYEELRGHAEMPENGPGTAVYTKPEGLEFELPEGTLFPMAHTIALRDHARAGDTFFNSTVFDGSDEEGPVQISAFIGGKVNVMAEMEPGPEIDAGLLNATAYSIRMAFFPLLDPAEDAEYEMDMVMHENGVISDMTIDYKTFSVSQKLAALEELDAAGCNSKKE